MIFQPWNWYRENYSIVQSQIRNIKKNFIRIAFISVYWCSIRCPHHMIFVSVNSNSMSAISGAGTAYTSVFCVVLCRTNFLLAVLLSIVLDLRLVLTLWYLQIFLLTWFVSRLTWRVPLLEQKLYILPALLPGIFSWGFMLFNLYEQKEKHWYTRHYA
jgi:hypothetical protein